jgi:hypothetical protein
VVQTTENDALNTLSGGDSQNIDPNVYLIQLTGQFTGNTVPVSPGEAPPSGNTLWFTLDQSSLDLLDLSVTDSPQSQRTLSKHGTVVLSRGTLPTS